ncbi:hypothetical protein EDB70_103660 [Vibrio crassostreae]|nr:hypothetical protein EDB70_103660 [Vibrio crassostreae]
MLAISSGLPFGMRIEYLPDFDNYAFILGNALQLTSIALSGCDFMAFAKHLV